MAGSIRSSLKDKPLNGYIILVTAVLYCANRFYLKSHSSGLIRYILNCHFNDFMGGIMFVAYTNVFLNIKNRPLEKLAHITVFSLIVGLIWEFGAPFIRADSTADWIDVGVYVLGGAAYRGILKIYNDINSKKRNKINEKSSVLDNADQSGSDDR